MKLYVRIAAAGVFGLLLFAMAAHLHAPTLPVGTRMVEVGNTTVYAEVAETPEAREQGLSGREALAPGNGMLFVFDEPGKYGFWMKDMRFALDILWSNTEGEIVTIARNVSPDTYPKAFYPSQDSLYVLEVPAGFAQAHGVVEGGKIVVK